MKEAKAPSFAGAGLPLPAEGVLGAKAGDPCRVSFSRGFRFARLRSLRSNFFPRRSFHSAGVSASPAYAVFAPTFYFLLFTFVFVLLSFIFWYGQIHHLRHPQYPSDNHFMADNF